jgi:hypothetical protein
MTAHRITLSLITLLIGLLLLVVAYNLPLTKEYRLLAPNDLTVESFLLTPGHTMKQTYLSHGTTQSGIRIFTYAPVITDQELLLQIKDNNDLLLATGHLTGQSFLASNDAVVLDYSFPWFTTKPNQPLTLTLSLSAGRQLPINISAHNTYHGGTLYLDDVQQPGDLALASIHPAILNTDAKIGATVGIAFVLTVTLIFSFVPSYYQWLAAAALLIIATPLSLLGFWFSTGDLGIADWDLYFSYHEVIRRTVLNFHVFPFWNPWLCGGTAALGDPEFPLFTLTFLLELIFGIPIGFPLAIYLSVATTAVGLLLLARRLHLSLLASLLTALAGTFGGVTIIEIVEGHPNVFAAMWIPWIFWAWLGAYRQNNQRQQQNTPPSTRNNHGQKKPLVFSYLQIRASNLFRVSKVSHRRQAGSRPRRENFKFNLWSLICGLFLALTFYAGGIYLLMYTLLAFIFITFLVNHPLTAILTTFSSGLWALGFAALKLLPVLFWLSNYPDKIYAGSSFSLLYLTQILFGRHLHGSNIIFRQDSGWHEYGAYIGYFVFALALLGISQVKRHHVVRALLVAATSAILLSSVGPALQPYFDHLPFLPRSNISRFILFGIIPISLLAGYGLDVLLASFSGISQRKIIPITQTQESAPLTASQKQYIGSSPLPQPLPIKLIAAIMALFIIALIAIDLFSFSAQLSSQSFVLPRVTNPPPPAPYPIAHTAQRFDQTGDSSRTTRSYTAILQGYGTLTYCSVLGPDPMVRTIHDEVDNGLLLTQPSLEEVKLIDWSPNEATFQIASSQPAKLVLNTNFAPGWQAQTVSGQTVTLLPVFGDSGRVATNIPPGEQTISFIYRTKGFIPGLIITLSTLALALFQAYAKRKSNLS